MGELHCWRRTQGILFILNQCFIGLLCGHLGWKGCLEVQPLRAKPTSKTTLICKPYQQQNQVCRVVFTVFGLS